MSAVPPRSRARPRARRAVAGAALGAALLAGCAPALDRDRAAVCRIAAAGLAAPVRLRVTAQGPLPPHRGAPAGIRLDLSPEDPDVPLRRLDCRFADGDLVALVTERGPLDATHFYLLRRFWLGLAEAADADPGFDDGTRSPDLPLALAFPLQMVLNALPNAAVYGLLAAAYALVYGLSGRINLAFGEVAAAGGLAAVAAAAALGGTPPSALLPAVAVAGLWASGLHGLAAERLVLWRLRGASGQQALIATVGLALALAEYLRLVTGARPHWVAPVLADPLRLARAGPFEVTVTPMALLLAAAAALVAGALAWGFRRTRFGRDWRAAADDPGAAALLGVDPRRLSAATSLLAAALAGLAGAGLTLQHGGTDVGYMTGLGLKALVAAVVGGIGSVGGALAGGVAIALVEAVWSAYGAIAGRDLAVDALLVLTLVLRPGGFFGFRDLAPRRV